MTLSFDFELRGNAELLNDPWFQSCSNGTLPGRAAAETEMGRGRGGSDAAMSEHRGEQTPAASEFRF